MSKFNPFEELLEQHLKDARVEYERGVKFAPGRKFEFDFLVNGFLAVEIEGGIWIGGRHVSGAGFTRDIEKYNLATMLGYRLARFTPRAIEKGEAIKWILDYLAQWDVGVMPVMQEAQK